MRMIFLIKVDSRPSHLCVGIVIIDIVCLESLNTVPTPP